MAGLISDGFRMLERRAMRSGGAGGSEDGVEDVRERQRGWVIDWIRARLTAGERGSALGLSPPGSVIFQDPNIVGEGGGYSDYNKHLCNYLIEGRNMKRQLFANTYVGG